ncbi:hypothetical protein GCM10025864_11180 [Luteimicrobium album]|uniref:Uncharacterized protein n=1 Tax=Luteimicrobium album TaxID=1054550 RepID=A0ABQ6I0P4_9MICO|nr:hypothetical protein [Luteimicrobium album]GMA23359.1 hypothetical protein GCM10025864_11180 [Luteimicrobium album]
MPTLTDKGYQGAGIGVLHPLSLPTNAHADDLTCFSEITAAALVLSTFTEAPDQNPGETLL